jgi:hypothetical protein
MTTKPSKEGKRTTTERLVRFTASGVHVDVGRYLKSSEGKRALDRIEAASKQFRLKKAAG